MERDADIFVSYQWLFCKFPLLPHLRTLASSHDTATTNAAKHLTAQLHCLLLPMVARESKA